MPRSIRIGYLGASRRRSVERLDGQPRAEAMEKRGIPAGREEDDARQPTSAGSGIGAAQASATRMLQFGEAALRKTRGRGANASLEKQTHRD